jgi:hypothetical protein
MHEICKITWWKLMGTRENPQSQTENGSTDQYGSNHFFMATPVDNPPIFG